MLTETEQAALVRRLIAGEPMTRLESITARVLHGIGGSQRDRDDLLWVLADLDAARGQVAALRDALRAAVVERDFLCVWCHLCHWTTAHNAPERHAAGCLAAPQPDGAALSAQPQDGEAGRG